MSARQFTPAPLACRVLFPTLIPFGALLVGFLVSLAGPNPAGALQIGDLQGPQSCVADEAGEQYFISNANGDPEVKDNNGFITKLDGSGKVLKLEFIRGGKSGVILHAPKGMALIKQTLYVADIDTLRAFDTVTGKPLHTVSFTRFPGVALADVVHDGQGILYASDTETDSIYRVDTTKDHSVSILVQDEALAGPSGLTLHPKTGNLIVASWKKGKILEVDRTGKITEVFSNSFFSSRFHNLSGLDYDRFGSLYLSDFTAGKVWRMGPDGNFKVIAEFLHSPADLAVDRKNHLILVPYHYANAAEINGLESPAHLKKKRKRTLEDYGFRFTKPSQKGQEDK